MSGVGDRELLLRSHTHQLTLLLDLLDCVPNAFMSFNLPHTLTALVQVVLLIPDILQRKLGKQTPLIQMPSSTPHSVYLPRTPPHPTPTLVLACPILLFTLILP